MTSPDLEGRHPGSGPGWAALLAAAGVAVAAGVAAFGQAATVAAAGVALGAVWAWLDTRGGP